MSISVNWATKVIFVPQNYLSLVSGSVYELDTNQFRLDLKALEASSEGMPFDDTHAHNTQVTVGGVTLARVVEIINGYTITFEDGQYAVKLLGANSNIGDVVNVNQVSIRSGNSAGLVTSAATELNPAAVAAAVWNSNSATYTANSTFGNSLNNVSAGADPTTIAAAVWNKDLVSHANTATFGGRMQKILTKIQSLYLN
jgi:hypothetical protein